MQEDFTNYKKKFKVDASKSTGLQEMNEEIKNELMITQAQNNQLREEVE